MKGIPPMTKSTFTFRRGYLLYLLALAALMLAAVLYVRSVLSGYEANQPERQVEAAMTELAADAQSGALWDKYRLPSVTPGRFEQDMELQSAYLALYDPEAMGFSLSSAPHAEGELVYNIHNNGFALAQVTLRTAGEPVTRLGILTSQNWEVASLEPVFTAHDFTLSLPTDFSVAVNGVPLTEADGTPGGLRTITYTIPGSYVMPELSITDPSGRSAGYTFRGNQILPELYNYSLTLPAALRVTVDGVPVQGQAADSAAMVRYDIVQLDQPDVQIADPYGNTVPYTGGDELPLTYMTISTVGGTVRLDGVELTADETRLPAEYANFADYVPGLPQVSTYYIAVLREDAEITVTDRDGVPVELEPGQHTYDLTSLSGGLESVPAEIAAEIDVVDTAQKWSLFMSNDLRFKLLSPYLIKDSYQYEVAYKYANGVDITFTSNHSLKNPAFTEVSATNFVYIADNCFSVDIHFVKHMLLTRTGASVDDEVNDRFYFVKYDDTDDGKNNPTWKIAGMKEIVNNAG